MATTSRSRRLLGSPGFLVPLGCALVALLSLGFLNLASPGLLDDLESRTLDYRFRIRDHFDQSPPASSAILQVDMDDASVAEFGRMPWPRHLLAEAIQKLHAAGARGIALDLFFREATKESEDAPLESAMEEAGPVVTGVPVRLALVKSGQVWAPQPAGLSRFLMPFRFPSGAEPYQVSQFYEPLPRFATRQAGVGHIAGEGDPDGVFRRFPLLVSLNETPLPSLGLLMACMALRADPSRMELKDQGLRIPGANGTVIVPVDRHEQMWLNFPGPFSSGFSRLSFRDVLARPADEIANLVRDRVCLIGITSTGSDAGSTPLEHNVPRSMIHSVTAGTILTGNSLTGAGPWEQAALLALLVIGLPLLAHLLRPAFFAGASLGILAAWVISAVILFVQAGHIAPLVEPLFLGVATVLATLQYKLLVETRERRVTEQTFSRYFSPLVVEKLLSDPSSLNVERRELTILFSDIKGFTSLSESMEPDDMQELLRTYFDRMTEIVFRQGGTVDKFIGDGLMAFFGAPVWMEDHAQRAVQTAVEMQREVRRFAQQRLDVGKVPVEIRIGVNTGHVTVGNLGASRRMEYSVIGSAVNQAQRLEANAPVGGVLIGVRTRGLVKDAFSLLEARHIQVKGIDHPVEVYQVDLKD